MARESHLFERHIGGLAIAMSAWILISGKHVFTVSAERLDSLKKL
ncbi:hypothetical protein ALP50_02142 [Pseudomonas syringae pv. spinaceae]|nr:hypothetical protein ALP50_02142 [Pseudomonas syringae pv. spinaceae]